jgi:hypothetical protein
MDEKSEKRINFNPRTVVIMALWGASKLDDTMLSKERMQIFKNQPFTSWPQDMQTELAPYGADMIV